MSEALQLNRTIIGDCRQSLCGLPAGTFQCCVTSPPYWGLRNYGHPQQIGLEKTPEEFVAELVAVFREVHRVLRNDGTLWLNIGDSYAAAGCGGGGRFMDERGPGAWSTRSQLKGFKKTAGLKHKDMVGIPWMLAFALRADGWWLRSEIVWAKPSPMPESVKDRPTKSHEKVFLLAKSRDYLYNEKAIREPVSGGAHPRGNGVNPKARANAAGNKQNANFSAAVNGLVDDRNARDVWTIAAEPYSGAHFATMPKELARRCILAGSLEGAAVLDPFFGSGTVGLVAESLGRKWLGLELNPEYAPLIAKRTAQVGLAFEEPAPSVGVAGAVR
jgi:DNA modification methylase